MIRTHYDNLQVAQNASDEVIRGAYKYLCQKWHPDRQPADKRNEAERIMKLINEAYEVLSDPARRRQHDQWIAEELAKQKQTDPPHNPPPHNPANGLSEAVREQYAKAIASGKWPWALVSSVLWMALFFGLIAQIEWANTQMTTYPVATSILFVLFTWGSASDNVDKKKKALLGEHDDASLQMLYNKASRTRMVLSICASILVAAGMVGYALMREKQPSETGKGTTVDASAPSPAEKKPKITIPPDMFKDVKPVAVAPLTKPLSVINECKLPVNLQVASKDNSKADNWNVQSVKLKPGDKGVLDDKASVAATFYYAVSEDRTRVWVADKSDATAINLTLDGQSESLRFRKVDGSGESATMQIWLQCE